MYYTGSPCTNGHSVNGLLKEAAANARAQLEKERNGIEQSLCDIVDVQVPTEELRDKTHKF
jgi:SWI/SNF related-matrix-associated actin-dependent regulator of chromatin subfamily C